MKVAEAILFDHFLDGSHAIEYTTTNRRGDDAYYIRQVAAADDGQPLLIERHRNFGSTLKDPLPRWEVLRGSGIGPNGFYGLWLPHLGDLLAECRLVPLDIGDRPIASKKVPKRFR